MRLRTLPASIAGVAAGTGLACHYHSFRLLPMLICLIFAVSAQIASNFANEYYDFKNGLDRKGRDGFRRGVTEGDLPAEAMKRATYGTLLFAALAGCSLIYWGGWWLIPVGVLIGLFAIGYSAGPYPLSHHGLGDIAVVVFFGLVPVIFTEYVQSGHLNLSFLCWGTALAIGLLAANILIVNNYRDYEDDRKVGKHTTVVIFGRSAMRHVYLLNALAALILLVLTTPDSAPAWFSATWVLFTPFATAIYTNMKKRDGRQLNLSLKHTAMLLLAASLWQLTILCTFTSDV